MKTTLFERWRRKSSKLSEKSRQRSRPLHVEFLEQRALLTATTVGTFASHDVNHDGYFNVADVIKLVGYVNSHGFSAVSSGSQSTGTGSGATSFASSASSNAGMDVNGDGYVNVLDIVNEIRAFDGSTKLASYSLVATDVNDVPITTPILVGTKFFIDVKVQDLRAAPTGSEYRGVLSGDVDVSYTNGLINPTAIVTTAFPSNPPIIQAGADYPGPTSGAHGDPATGAGQNPSVVFFVQGFQNPPDTATPLGGTARTLDRIGYTANTAGVVNFQTQISDAIGEITELLRSGPSATANDFLQLTPDEITFGGTSVTIINSPPVPATLSGTVYVDANNNHQLDAGEGHNGVTVNLFDASSNVVPVASLVTSSGGQYSFTNLNPGTYKVQEVAPGGNLIETFANVGTGATSVGTAGQPDSVSSITLGSGNTAVNYNFALQQLTSISGTVYLDANKDNLFEAGEAGTSNVTITLSGQDVLGNSVLLQSQHVSGAYSFTNLNPGTYTLTESTPLPAGFYASAANVGTVDVGQPGTKLNNASIQSIALGSGATGSNYNFGEQTTVSLAGTVYFDANGNSTFDGTDSAQSGVTVQLTGQDVNGAAVSLSTQTVAGVYLFTNITPGTYSVHETPPAGLVATAANPGTGAGGSASGFDTLSNLNLVSGTNASNYNFGVQSQAPALVKYTLLATDVNDVPLSGNPTVGQFFYIDVLVQDLRPVAYAGVASAEVDVTYVAQGGGTSGATATGNIFAGPSYPNPSAGNRSHTPTTGLVPDLQGFENLSTSGGVSYYAPLGGTALVLDRIEMHAVAPGVVLLNTQLSAGETNLLASNTGVQNITDTFAVPANQVTQALTLPVTIDPVPASLSGTVYVDANNNGQRDGGETGKAGVQVELLNSIGTVVAGPVVTADGTGANPIGFYSFGNLAPGTYSVQELSAAGVIDTVANVGVINGASSPNVGVAQGFTKIANVTIGSGDVASNYNFGVQLPATLSGTVYVDANNDNLFEAGEAGTSDDTITLSGTDIFGNPVNQTLQHVSGSYSFSNLNPGTYTLTEQTPLPTGFYASAANVGSVSAGQSGTKLNNSTIQSITLSSGATGSNYNFGAQPTVSLGGTVYIDSNKDNLFEAGEPGFSNVTITLSGTDVFGNAVNLGPQQPVNGAYLFSNLIPGTYSLHEGTPTGEFATVANLGLVNGVAKGTVTAVDTIQGIDLTPSGSIGSSYNFGLQDQPAPKAEVRLVGSLDQAGTIPLPATIQGGSKFWVFEYVEDLRQPPSAALGVEAAYTNINFDPTKFAVVPNTLSFSPAYSNVTLSSSNLHDIGGLNPNEVFGNQQVLVLMVQMQAIGAGTSDIVPAQPDPIPNTPLGIIMQPSPGATPLSTPEINFVGLQGLASTAPSIISIDPSTSVTNITSSNATTPMHFTVHIDQALGVPVTVQYTTQITGGDNAVPGTSIATPGANFIQPNYDNAHPNVGQVVIQSGLLSASFDVPVIGDPLNEADKTFHVVLTTADNGAVISSTAASSLATIHSGVALPSVTIGNTAGNQGGSAVFNVTLSAASGQVVTVHYQTQATSPQSAVPGTDFEVKSGDIVFNPGDPLTKQISVALPVDNAETTPTQFQVVLSTTATSHATLATTSAIGTINPPPLGSLSGYVYFDANNNGNRDGGETGYGGVTVLLSGVDTFGRTVSMSTTTASNGYYIFTGLAQGEYFINEVQPTLFLQGQDKIGSQGGDASVIDQFMIALGAGVNGTENDFGEGGLDPNMFWWPYF